MDIVLDAAAQLLERDGEPGFNTNALAERAGVSIGTIYRYFPDKRAVLAALADRETRAHHAALAAVLAEGGEGVSRDRAMIRAFTRAFGGRSEARRVAMTAWLAAADPRELAAGHAPVEAGFVDADGQPLSPVAAFVLSRAMQGAMRAAVLEGVDFLTSREFEDELVRLSRAYLKAPRSCPPS